LQRVLTTVTLLGLLVATAAAFAITEHLKLIKSPVYGTLVSKVLSPVCHCADRKATIRIRLRHRDDVTVTIVNSAHETVATIASGRPVEPHQPVLFAWDGRTDTGTLAPDGVYHPWVHLAHARRTFRFTNRIVLDTQAPRIISASDRRGILYPGSRQKLAIHYVFSEPAHAVVYLGRHRILLGRQTRPHGKVEWDGELDGKALHAGTYVLSVGAVDRAGNETPPAKRRSVTAVVRYIEIAPRSVEVRARARFAVRVDTQAPRYAWRFAGRHGTGHGKMLRLRAPAKRGAYRLLVTEHGHAARAVVRVRAR
jgi:FlgD Ig-like domain